MILASSQSHPSHGPYIMGSVDMASVAQVLHLVSMGFSSLIGPLISPSFLRTASEKDPGIHAVGS